MSLVEIVQLLAALIGDSAKLIADLHAGAISPADAEARIKTGLVSFATDRAAEDKEIQALPNPVTP